MNISQVTSKINSFFDTINSKITKVVPMPAILLLCACMNKPGVSPLRSLTNVCKSLESLGIPTTSNPDGSQNLIVASCYALLTEICRMLTEDAVVQGAVETGKLNILSTGANAAGAVESYGTNLLPFNFLGSLN